MTSKVDVFASDFFNEHVRPDGLENSVELGTGTLLRNGRRRQRSVTRIEDYVARLSHDGLNHIGEIGEHVCYPLGTILVTEGRVAARAMLLLAGEVSLSATSRNGRQVSMGMARPGEVLGLEYLIPEGPSGMRAEALSACRVVSLRRLDFVAFLRRDPAAFREAARQLAGSYAHVWQMLAQRDSSGRAPLDRHRISQN